MDGLKYHKPTEVTTPPRMAVANDSKGLLLLGVEAVAVGLPAAMPCGLAMIDSISTRTSPIACQRSLRLLVRQRRSSSRSRGLILDGSTLKSGSIFITDASRSETSSPL